MPAGWMNDMTYGRACEPWPWRRLRWPTTLSAACRRRAARSWPAAAQSRCWDWTSCNAHPPRQPMERPSCRLEYGDDVPESHWAHPIHPLSSIKQHYKGIQSRRRARISLGPSHPSPLFNQATLQGHPFFYPPSSPPPPRGYWIQICPGTGEAYREETEPERCLLDDRRKLIRPSSPPGFRASCCSFRCATTSSVSY
jgi:hypothetical protein